MYHDHIDGRGVALFEAIRDRDLEGVVAKWKGGRYHTDGQTTSWLKVRNPTYPQVEQRREVFAPRRSVWTRSRAAAPLLAPELAQRADATPGHNQQPRRRRRGNGLD